MRRTLFFLWLVCVPSMIVYGQVLKNFDCGLFSFDYPSSFKTIPIQNAPHMVLKLESDDYYFSASYWEKGLDKNISIWDNEFYELYKNPVGDGTLISITKEIIQTKSGSHRCLKLKTNIHRQNQGMNINIKMLTYLMLHDGYLFTFAFSSQGNYSKETSTTYPDRIMKGLRFKSLQNSFSDLDNALLEKVKKLNAQCPIMVDECTTHLQIVLSGKTVMIKTLVEDICDDVIDYDEFKQKMCENFSVALEKAFVQYLDKNGYSVVYMIYNEKEKLKKKITVSGHDILSCY